MHANWKWLRVNLLLPAPPLTRMNTHTHRSVSGSFGFFCWASCRVCGSDRGASFESRFKCWCTWSISDSSQMKYNKQIKKKQKKYPQNYFSTQLDLFLYQVNHSLERIFLLYSEVTHNILLYQSKIYPFSCIFLCVDAAQKRQNVMMNMINKSYMIPSELLTYFCVHYFFKDWAWAISQQMRGGSRFCSLCCAAAKCQMDPGKALVRLPFQTPLCCQETR